MTLAQTQLLLVGLPASGKSTYLGACYYMLRNGSDSRLQMVTEPEERDYLQELEDHWLRFNPFERSKHQVPKEVELSLRGTELGDFALSIPDVTGESYNDLWEEGRWRDEVRNLAASADGILLFVSADNLKKPKLIDVRSKTSEATELEDWTPELASTQVKLCDLLESIDIERGGDMPPIAIVVSAWDKAVELKVSSKKWLELQTPLLWQWLMSRSDSIHFDTFAVSAQGGDLRDVETKKRLASFEDPLQRLEEVSGIDSILEPILWLCDE